MKRSQWMVLLVLFAALAGMGGISSREVSAQEIDDGSVMVLQDAGANEIERWWGALGATLCGIEGRLVRVAPAIGFNPYVMAAGIGGCLLAVIDIATT